MLEMIGVTPPSTPVALGVLEGVALGVADGVALGVDEGVLLGVLDGEGV